MLESCDYVTLLEARTQKLIDIKARGCVTGVADELQVSGRCTGALTRPRLLAAFPTYCTAPRLYFLVAQMKQLGCFEPAASAANSENGFSLSPLSGMTPTACFGRTGRSLRSSAL